MQFIPRARVRRASTWIMLNQMCFDCRLRLPADARFSGMWLFINAQHVLRFSVRLCAFEDDWMSLEINYENYVVVVGRLEEWPRKLVHMGRFCDAFLGNIKLIWKLETLAAWGRCFLWGSFITLFSASTYFWKCINSFGEFILRFKVY